MIPNCAVTKSDILRAEDIFGKNIGVLQGKTMRKKMPYVTTAYEDLPTGNIERHGQVTLETDIMNINEVPFVITTSRNIHFCTAELIKNEKAATIAMSIKQVILMYTKRGFTIKHIHGDGQFEHIKFFLADTDININITGLNEHVPGME